MRTAAAIAAAVGTAFTCAVQAVNVTIDTDTADCSTNNVQVGFINNNGVEKAAFVLDAVSAPQINCNGDTLALIEEAIQDSDGNYQVTAEFQVDSFDTAANGNQADTFGIFDNDNGLRFQFRSGINLMTFQTNIQTVLTCNANIVTGVPHIFVVRCINNLCNGTLDGNNIDGCTATLDNTIGTPGSVLQVGRATFQNNNDFGTGRIASIEFLSGVNLIEQNDEDTNSNVEDPNNKVDDEAAGAASTFSRCLAATLLANLILSFQPGR